VNDNAHALIYFLYFSIFRKRKYTNTPKDSYKERARGELKQNGLVFI
jgi:hypothetical protein